GRRAPRYDRRGSEKNSRRTAPSCRRSRPDILRFRSFASNRAPSWVPLMLAPHCAENDLQLYPGFFFGNEGLLTHCQHVSRSSSRSMARRYLNNAAGEAYSKIGKGGYWQGHRTEILNQSLSAKKSP